MAGSGSRPLGLQARLMGRAQKNVLSSPMRTERTSPKQSPNRGKSGTLGAKDYQLEGPGQGIELRQGFQQKPSATALIYVGNILTVIRFRLSGACYVPGSVSLHIHTIPSFNLIASCEHPQVTDGELWLREMEQPAKVYSRVRVGPQAG